RTLNDGHIGEHVFGIGNFCVGRLAVDHPRTQIGAAFLFHQTRTKFRGHVFSGALDRKSTRLNSSHLVISYAVFCLKKTKAASVNAPIRPEGRPAPTPRLTRRRLPPPSPPSRAPAACRAHRPPPINRLSRGRFPAAS